jgi:Tfp pilus assembly ATPase PilU
MYSMDNLLTLITTEQARELRFRAGTPPVVFLGEEPHPMEGPPLTSESAEQLLRSIASTRQMRELRERGAVTFIYTQQGTSPFLIRAVMEGNSIVFNVD